LLKERGLVFEAAAVKRQDRVLIPLANDGLLLWESLRLCPEGLSAALVDSQGAKEALERYAQVLDEAEKPVIAVAESLLPSQQQAREWFLCGEFDHILMRGNFRKSSHKSYNCRESGLLKAQSFKTIAGAAKLLLAKSGNVVLLASPQGLGERISRIVAEECGERALSDALKQAEDKFFSNKDEMGFWDEADLRSAFEENGFKVNIQGMDMKEERLISEKDLNAWFDSENSRWGSFMAKALKDKDFTAIEQSLRLRISKGPVLWKWQSLLLTGTP
jgi:hypothetical protein